jgi:hypothetical protein
VIVPALTLPGEYSKTIGKASKLAIMSATGVVGQTSTLFHCDSPVA